MTSRAEARTADRLDVSLSADLHECAQGPYADRDDGHLGGVPRGLVSAGQALLGDGRVSRRRSPRLQPDAGCAKVRWIVCHLSQSVAPTCLPACLGLACPGLLALGSAGSAAVLLVSFRFAARFSRPPSWPVQYAGSACVRPSCRVSLS